MLSSCNVDDGNLDQPEAAFIGNWQLDTLSYHRDIWLRDLPLAEWESLFLTFETHSSDSVKMTAANSPDANIFPPTSIWGLNETIEWVQYSGKIQGNTIEGLDYRSYRTTLVDDTLIINVLVEPDCPEGEDCTLAICCDVQFEFLRVEAQ